MTMRKPKIENGFPKCMENKSEEFRKNIIAKAMRLFAKEGLSFTMQELAKSMHISKKTIYVYYPSKEQLLMDMVDEAFCSIHAKKDAILLSNEDLLTKLQKVIIALPDDYSALDLTQLKELEEKYPAVANKVHEHLNTGWEPTLRLLQEAMDTGVIRKISLPVLKAMVSSSIETFMQDRSIMKESKLTYTEILEEMISILLEGLVRR